MLGRLGGAGERRRIAERVRAVLAAHQPTGWVPQSAVPDRDPLSANPAQRAAGRHATAGTPGRWRLDPGRRTAALVGAVVLLVALVAGAWVLLSRPDGQSVPVPGLPAPSAVPTRSVGAPGASGGAAGRPAVTASTTAAELVIDVVGKVMHPGIYRVPSGSRVDDVLRAAGGTLPGTDLTGLNLARRVADGEQVAVGVAAALPAGGSGFGGSASGAAASGPVDLNSASVQQLDGLPGVGPVLAQHIVDWRTAHGSFTSIQQLRQVSGIGDAKFADLEPLVTV